MTFSFNLFATLVQNLKFVPSATRKLLNLNQDHLSKNLCKIEVVITSLIEMLELPKSCDKVLLVTSWREIMT